MTTCCPLSPGALLLLEEICIHPQRHLLISLVVAVPMRLRKEERRERQREGGKGGREGEEEGGRKASLGL